MAFFYDVVAGVCVVSVGIMLLAYFAPIALLSCLRPQNLKTKYNATWALVTGASTGIGRAVAETLAGQGLNVVLVGLPDHHLDKALTELTSKYADQQFRSVGVYFKPEVDYMGEIAAATSDIPVSIVVSNAGYLLLGFFIDRKVEDHLALLECNLTAAIRISHHFLKKIGQAGTGGCICFTSSSVWYMPAPFAMMYGASKAGLSNFVSSLAIEAKDEGVDVVAVHPSYTRTNLYEKSPSIGVLRLMDKFAATSEDVADTLLASVGRVVIRDTGHYAFLTKIATNFVDPGLISKIIIPLRTTIPEYIHFKKSGK